MVMVKGDDDLSSSLFPTNFVKCFREALLETLTPKAIRLTGANEGVEARYELQSDGTWKRSRTIGSNFEFGL